MSRFGRDSLADSEKVWLDDVIRDRDHFLAHTAPPAPVRRLRVGQPVFILDGPDDLVLIYEEKGSDIEVLDLLNHSTLEWLRSGA